MSDKLSEEDFTAIEQAAYEAAVIPELWPNVLARLGEVAQAYGAVMFSVTHSGALWTASENMHGHMRDFVEKGWAERNTRMSKGLRKGVHLQQRFVTEADYYEPGEVDSDELNLEFFRPRDLGNSAGMVAVLPHGDMICISVEKGFKAGPVTSQALAMLDSLRPHLGRAALLATRLGFERVRTAIDTLAAVGLPAAAVTPQGRVIHASDAFAGATHVWTTRSGDRVGLNDRVADAMLTQALTMLDLAKSPRSIPVRAEPGGAVTAVLQVVPVRRHAHDIFGSTSAIVILSEPKMQTADAALIHSLFDLTPAEIAVARSVAAGMTVGQIALATGRSPTTVRNQLKSVMAKTGSSRQVELVLLMQQLQIRAN
jgi:DNA-binding CsgD family transcriptional regulator